MIFPRGKQEKEKRQHDEQRWGNAHTKDVFVRPLSPIDSSQSVSAPSRIHPLPPCLSGTHSVLVLQEQPLILRILHQPTNPPRCLHLLGPPTPPHPTPHPPRLNVCVYDMSASVCVCLPISVMYVSLRLPSLSLFIVVCRFLFPITSLSRLSSRSTLPAHCGRAKLFV